MIAGVRRWGVGSGASRLITGDAAVFHDLEAALAEFKGAEAALVFNSGYQANLGIFSSLLSEGDVVFSDELNHASIIDGIRLSKAERGVFRHNDMGPLREGLREFRRRKGADSLALIATESVFSMDGDLSPLEEMAALASEFDAWLFVDEAHATGVFGEKGEGRCAGIQSRNKIEPRLIQMGTLGKALGCFGAYLAGSRELIELMMQRARPFIFTTALPPAVVAAALEALRIVQSEASPRERLWQRVRLLAEGMGVQPVSPIFPWIVGDAKAAVDLSQKLREAGLWVQAIRPPTVPEGSSRLRITVMAEHTEEDIKRLAELIQ